MPRQLSVMPLIRRPAIRWGWLVVLVLFAACSHPKSPDDAFFPERPSVPVFVDNENYLDVNVSVVTGGVPRRLGDVPGNSQRKFTLSANVAYSEPIYLTATAIGARDSYSSSTLNVGYGQVIELHLGVNLRQSVAFLRDSL